jgi:hypothetical protein
MTGNHSALQITRNVPGMLNEQKPESESKPWRSLESLLQCFLSFDPQMASQPAVNSPKVLSRLTALCFGELDRSLQIIVQ